MNANAARCSITKCHGEALAAHGDIHAPRAWPPFPDRSQFPWCCGECRFQRDAFLRDRVCFNSDLSRHCPCSAPAILTCLECSGMYCLTCFCALDDYFLLSHKRNCLDTRPFRARNIPSIENLKRTRAMLPDEYELAGAANDPEAAEAIHDAQVIQSEIQSQDDQSDALVESRAGSAAHAFQALFKRPGAIQKTNGYILNEFVTKDDTPLSESGASESSFVDSIDNAGCCAECGQPLLHMIQRAAETICMQAVATGAPNPQSLTATASATKHPVIPPPNGQSNSGLPTTPIALSPDILARIAGNRARAQKILADSAPPSNFPLRILSRHISRCPPSFPVYKGLRDSL